MAMDSKSPDEVLAFWRDLKAVIQDKVAISQVYDLHEILAFVLEDVEARDRLFEELERKEYRYEVIRLAEAHGIRQDADA